MTGIQDALALLVNASRVSPELRAALARVEAEIARLGNALAQERSKPEGSFDQWSRLQAAEAEVARLQDGLRRCPICTHEWHRHDPEDGKCDAGSGDLGECPCGRDDAYHRVRNAALSKAALLAEEGAAPPPWTTMHDGALDLSTKDGAA